MLGSAGRILLDGSRLNRKREGHFARIIAGGGERQIARGECGRIA